MKVALCRIQIRLYGVKSLKEKRGIVQPLILSTSSKFRVSIAEVGENDSWKKLILGIAFVSNKASHANQVLSLVLNHIEQTSRGSELVDYELEILKGF
mgnify:CR=1 FL=1